MWSPGGTLESKMPQVRQIWILTWSGMWAQEEVATEDKKGGPSKPKKSRKFDARVLGGLLTWNRELTRPSAVEGDSGPGSEFSLAFLLATAV